MTSCPVCLNAHSDDCTPAALKARIAALQAEASEAAMVAAVGESVVAALRGEEVSDFMQSFGPVMEAQTMVHTIALLQGDVEAQRRVIVDACAHLRVTDDDEADWPKLPGAVLQLTEERDAARKLATAKAADVDRLTALLGAETERALKMERERDTLRAQLAASQTLAVDLRARLLPALDAAGVDYDQPTWALTNAVRDGKKAADALIAEVNRLRALLSSCAAAPNAYNPDPEINALVAAEAAAGAAFDLAAGVAPGWHKVYSATPTRNAGCICGWSGVPGTTHSTACLYREPK